MALNIFKLRKAGLRNRTKCAGRRSAPCNALSPKCKTTRKSNKRKSYCRKSKNKFATRVRRKSKKRKSVKKTKTKRQLVAYLVKQGFKKDVLQKMLVPELKKKYNLN